mmetsp:Transcript_7867/g.22371  ORF Transcript_7867/g.22371 Transcript_7867/m.22371 type:complete len:128 (+) Transcript_7867:38-421(+)
MMVRVTRLLRGKGPLSASTTSATTMPVVLAMVGSTFISAAAATSPSAAPIVPLVVGTAMPITVGWGSPPRKPFVLAQPIGQVGVLMSPWFCALFLLLLLVILLVVILSSAGPEFMLPRAKHFKSPGL